jgi:hypothetical protein
MKLQKIQDVRVGQVWQDTKTGRLVWVEIDNFAYCKPFEELCQDSKLVGFLGITHEVKNGKLVKIPRGEFDKDDVVDFGGRPMIVVSNYDLQRKLERPKVGLWSDFGDLDVKWAAPEEIKHLGTLGVDWELVNDRLAKEAEHE